jgi:hypothetical protein
LFCQLGVADAASKRFLVVKLTSWARRANHRDSADYSSLLKSDSRAAKREVLRVREEFLKALADGYVCRAFDRNAERPRYLLYPE